MFRNLLISSLRNLFRNKLFVVINVGGLILGVGSSIVLFTIVRFHQDFNKFNKNYNQVYRIVGEVHNENNDGFTATVPHPLGAMLKTEAGYLDKVSRYKLHGDAQITLSESDGDKKFMQGRIAFTDNEFFEILDFTWIAGAPSLDKPNNVVIDERTALKYFGNRPFDQVIGTTVTIGNLHELVIGGIYKDLPENSDFRFRMLITYENQEGINDYYSEGKLWGRLNGGTQCLVLLAANADLYLLQQQTNAIFEDHNVLEGYSLLFQPLSDIHFNSDFGRPGGPVFPNWATWTLNIIAILLIIASSINFINLSTAKATGRAKEVGVRKVLGSRKSTLVIQHLMETLIIVVISLLGALAVAELMFKLVAPIIEQELSLVDVSVSWIIGMMIMFLVSLTLLTGLYPSFIISSFRPIHALKAASFGTVRQKGKMSIRRILVTTQFVISQSLLIGILVVIWQNEFLRSQELGFNEEGIISILLPEYKPEKTQLFINELLSHPEFEKASAHLGSPVARVNNTGTLVNLNEEGSEYEISGVNFKDVDENYLDLFGLRLLAGENIRRTDAEERVLINESLMKKLGMNDPYGAIGQTIKTNWGASRIIKGVIADFNANSLHSELDPVILSYNEDYFHEVGVLMASTSQTAISGSLEKLNESWDKVFPEYVIQYDFLDERIERSYNTELKMVQLFRLFAILAITISCLGLYGLIDFMAVKKTKEIGIRKVLGAKLKNILFIFGKELVFLVGLSMIVSGPLMYWLLNQWLDNYAYRIEIGWTVFAIAIATILFASLATISYRSYKASNLNPVLTLKDE